MLGSLFLLSFISFSFYPMTNKSNQNDIIDYSSSQHTNEILVSNNTNNADDEEEPKRYEIYGIDETSSFSNAILLQSDGTFYYQYNQYNDVDYYKRAIYAGSTINISSSGYKTFKIYKKIGSNYTIYHNNNLPLGNPVLFDETAYYYFVFSASAQLVGDYSFTMSSVSINSFNDSTHFIHVKYDGGGLNSITIDNLNYENKPSSKTRDGFIGTYNSENYTGMGLLRDYAASNYFSYTCVDTNGIYDSYNNHSSNDLDDDRHITNNGNNIYYPSNCVLYIANNHLIYSGNSVISGTTNGSATFVSNTTAISAAHVMFTPNFTFANISMTASIIKNANTLDSDYTMMCSGFYIPISYYISRLNYPSGDYTQYDWSVMIINISTLPSSYTHSYIGIAYDSTLPAFNGYTYGFPRIQTPNVQNIKYAQARTNGNVFSYSSTYRTYMDVSSGQSGGSCFELIGSKPFLRGNICGATTSYTGNRICPTNKYNYHIVEDIENNVI